MNRALRVRNIAGALALVSVLFVTGCNRISGKYQAKTSAGTPIATVDFKSSDKADVTWMGETNEVPWEKDGNKITLHTPKGRSGGDIVLTVESDGSLSGGPMGLKLVKE